MKEITVKRFFVLNRPGQGSEPSEKKVSLIDIMRMKDGDIIKGPTGDQGYYYLKRTRDSIILYKRQYFKDGSWSDYFESHIVFNNK